MPAMRKRAKSLEPNANANQETGGTRKICLYEQCREERIKENLQRMQTLGILDLSLKLKSKTRPARRPFGNSDSGYKSTRDTPPLPPSGPVRRSSRLQNVTPVSYSEALVAKKGKALEEEYVQLEDGARPEIYTEEHEKLLGNTERSWTLFVDGYGKEGRRIYDPVRGKTCHQCRQKTLGYRTHCSQCNMVQGQFCGDCLYMRYGEHVHEALENPNWICPVCRGICNCSLCRTGKGWLPTGTIYKKISKLGYKSVAHYLIQTKRSQTNSEKELEATNQASAKRSLSFQDLEASSQKHSEIADDLPKMPRLQDRDNGQDDDHVDGNADDDSFQNEGDNNTDKNLNPARRSLSFLPSGDKQPSAVVQVQGDLKLSDNSLADEREMEPNSVNNGNQESGRESESCQESSRKRKVSVEPNPDSIAGRLRQRRRSHSGLTNEQIVRLEEPKQTVDTVSPEKAVA